MEEELIKKFKDYISIFDLNDENINRKCEHSIRVMDISKRIANDIYLDEKDLFICTIVGLLHDYARFPQWTKYKTFSDIDSIDHGDLGADLLIKQDKIKGFGIDKVYYEQIYNAIKYHNKYSYPEGLSNYNKLFCKIIRDADKVDIFYILSESNEYTSECNIISNNIKKEFFNNKLINKIDLKNSNDEIILLLSMIYDLNYDISYKIIKDNNYIDKMFNKIKNKELFKDYFDYIKKYINGRIDKNVR